MMDHMTHGMDKGMVEDSSEDRLVVEVGMVGRDHTHIHIHILVPAPKAAACLLYHSALTLATLNHANSDCDYMCLSESPAHKKTTINSIPCA